jgi:hypothetical protein
MTTWRLPKDWCLYIVNPGVDVKAPGIYEWRIEGGYVSIGASKSLGRRRREHRSNVARLLSGKPYHQRGRDYRPVHHALAKAVQVGKTITLTILENVFDDLFRRERKLKRERERGTLND